MGPACGKCEQGVVTDCFKPQCIIGDGFQKGVMSINRMIPGPPIHVCQGDQVVVDVKNEAIGTAATIHWHGLEMLETPFMDGVPYVTQCPIPYGTTFRYKFYARAPGTFFYHSHSGIQKLNGQYGALIVGQPDEDNLHSYEYDYDLPEHYLLISDWKHGYAENSFPGLPKGESYPDSILINGRGTHINKNTFERSQVPCTILYVKPGYRYRVNIINSYSLTDIVQMQIEDHSMIVIATDSYDVEPFEVDSLVTNSGERYDIIIEAYKTHGDYWIKFQGLNTLQPQPTESFVLLRYITSDADYKTPQPPYPAYNENKYPTGIRLNHPEAICSDNDNEYCVSDLEALEKDNALVTKKPDYQLIYSFYNNVFPVEKGFVPGKYKRFDNPEGDIIADGVVNNISLILPPQTILTQYSEVDKKMFCDKSNCPEKCDGESTRECIHLVKIKTDSIVEMTIHDQADVPGLFHPFHLHGYRFAVMGMSKDATNLTKAINDARKCKNRQPVWKDSVTIPRNGVMVARFRANNPGIWLMHCHYTLHLATGMAFLFQVGEPSEWVPTPVGFPKCGNYKPGVEKRVTHYNMIKKLLAEAFVVLVLSEYLALAQFANLTQYPGDLCDSKCVKGKKRLCYFEWTLELYQAMGPACGKCEQGVASDCSKPQCVVGDGHQKGVMSINRMIPGPPMHVCEGDQVIVDVKNMAPGTAATTHWHGLYVGETPFMDGVPFATQCPILFDSTFRYQFYASEPGTQFYHSHSGLHKLNGQYGALIIRKPDDDNPHIGSYDYDLPEHNILISDWKHTYGENSFPGIPNRESFPDSLLINGRGTYVDKNTFKHNQVPVTIFYVKPGARYRFRLMDVMSLADIVQIQFEKHRMMVISTDSYDVKPLEIDTLLMNAGERYDVVINTNHTEGDFWIRIRGAFKYPPQPTDSFALLRYVNNDSDIDKPQPPFPDYNHTFPIGIRLNHPQATCFQDDSEYCVVDLKALEKDTDLVTRKPDYRLKFSYQSKEFPANRRFVSGEYKRFESEKDLILVHISLCIKHFSYTYQTDPNGNVISTGIINNISLIVPPQPILTQYSEVDKSLFCNSSHMPDKCNGEPICECIHLIRIKTNSIVELTLQDLKNTPGMDHPFHLHGYRFALMGIENDTSNLTKAIENASKYKRSRPVWKDTVSIPRNGVAVLRFRADNPGIWLLHCHYELHMATGMALLFQVGEPDEWVRPPVGFPRCGNYMPGVKKGF
ncbi:LOW QUALITY PROTEIN: uncharacterized protein LOC129948201 [Eupeodes corollae]|uniref:LOW QUALITY PROTEIN: uncharacterized protein LOC129948201 n=1 Tax=Eupeodes corollae TaxID=290404 RepID=UPI002491F001|nr:LOW QUALITY PROTEIN: uncharacterized protein LOC129948201 [Eupeodes corollae]